RRRLVVGLEGVHQGDEMRGERAALCRTESLETRDETRLADVGRATEEGASGGRQGDHGAACVVRSRAPDHESPGSQPAHDHRDGALVGVRARRELVDRGRVAVHELVENEELRAADPEAPLGCACGDAERSHDAPQCVHDGANVDAVVVSAAKCRPPGHYAPPRSVLYWSQYIGKRRAVNRSNPSGIHARRDEGRNKSMHDDTGLDEKLGRKERAEENVFFGRRDRALVEKMRRRKDESRRELARMRCPDCGEALERAAYYGVTIERCPDGHGLWLTEAELHALAKRERNSWIARYFYRPRLT